MKLETLNDLARAVAGARADLGRLKDAIPNPVGAAGEAVLNAPIDAQLDALRALVDLDRLRALVETLA